MGVAIYDITAEVKYEAIDDGLLPLTKCACGAEWVAWEGPILQTDSSTPYECPECHSKLYWEMDIRIKCVDYPERNDEV